MPQNGGKDTLIGNSAPIIQKSKSTKEYTVHFPPTSCHSHLAPPPHKKSNVTSLLPVLPEIFYTNKYI